MKESLEEYDDPRLYDVENQSLMGLPLLLEWASKQDGVAVDLGCGAGRIAIPLAEKGISIVGVDIHKGML